MRQPGKVINPARGDYFSVPVRAQEFGLETGSAIPSRASLLISILRLNLVCLPTGFLPLSVAVS